MADIEFEFRFHIDLFPVARVLDVPNSQVSRSLNRTSDRLMHLGATKVGKRYSGTNNNKDGRASSLAKSGKVVQGSGAGWQVVFDHPAAAAHHNGAKEHGYESTSLHINKNPNTWTNSPYDDNHFALKGPFTHPGNAANPFLLDAARQLGLRSSGALKRGTAGPFPIVRQGFF